LAIDVKPIAKVNKLADECIGLVAEGAFGKAE